MHFPGNLRHPEDAMTDRPSAPRLLAPLLVAAFLPGTGSAYEPPDPPNLAQPYGGSTVLQSGPRVEIGAYAGAPFGPGFYHSGWPYGPRTAPGWGYPGLYGGPFVGYPWGYYGYGAASRSFWTNGLSLYGPPVPVYGPVPGVFGNNDLVRQWRQVPSPGIPFGWVGIYAASPRPRPLTVSVWPTVERVMPANPLPAPATGGGCLILSVKVPQPAAEVLVDGVKTSQTGTDRIFESPALGPGKEFRYEVTARWMERGALREEKRTAVGAPGEVVRLDFTAPQIIATGK